MCLRDFSKWKGGVGRAGTWLGYIVTRVAFPLGVSFGISELDICFSSNLKGIVVFKSLLA